MAHFCYASMTDFLPEVRLDPADVVQVGLWGGGPSGEDLDIVVTNPRVAKVEFPAELSSFPIPFLRVFEIWGLTQGQTLIEGRIRRSGLSYAASLRVLVGLDNPNDTVPFGMEKFYHGTVLDDAKKLMTQDLTPQIVPESLLLDLNEYTDFGKGLYTHPEESKYLVLEWAKRKGRTKGTDWGIVRFSLTTEELNRLRQNPAPLHFPDKRITRPSNSPKLFNGLPATWIEFVEFNKHIRQVTVKRPKDNDWSADYCWMRGPMWGRMDSNLPGPPGPPERYHQVNWCLNGLNTLNTRAAKARRFLITKHNERFL